MKEVRVLLRTPEGKIFLAGLLMATVHIAFALLLPGWLHKR